MINTNMRKASEHTRTVKKWFNSNFLKL